jgi:Uma2 family endonuclease
MATVETRVAASIEPTMLPTEMPIPELCAGDHLTRAEFERRYAAMSRVKKAELIEGVVCMPPPVSKMRSRLHFGIIYWLGCYRSGTPGLEGGADGTVRLDGENEPQPDAMLWILPERGGQTRNEEEYVAGAPELVAEIAVSSASYDLFEKLRAYQRNGVREYIIWRVRDAAIDWFVLREGRFEKLVPDASGCLKSEVFPGLWLDPAALLRDDLGRVMAVVHEGLASPEHAAFLEKLAKT